MPSAELPQEVWHLIALYFSIRQWAKVARTCRASFHAIILKILFDQHSSDAGGEFLNILYFKLRTLVPEPAGTKTLKQC